VPRRFGSRVAMSWWWNSFHDGSSRGASRARRWPVGRLARSPHRRTRTGGGGPIRRGELAITGLRRHHRSAGYSLHALGRPSLRRGARRLPGRSPPLRTADPHARCHRRQYHVGYGSRGHSGYRPGDPKPQLHALSRIRATPLHPAQRGSCRVTLGGGGRGPASSGR
jgi:hypothetical protein